MESLNSLRPPLIEQAEDGYRYSIEPFLLASFVHLPSNCRILDLGTGCGIIPLLLETRGMIKEIVGIEIQSTLYNLAVKNVSRNGVSNKWQSMSAKRYSRSFHGHGCRGQVLLNYCPRGN